MAQTLESGSGARSGAGTAAAIGWIVTRLLVPLWLLAGALTKLTDLSPSSMPSVLVTGVGGAGIDLVFFLRFSIAVELAAVAVIWLLPALARPVAAVMLGVFLAVLAGELAAGASSCGCFGSVQVHPGITLAIDGLLLAAVVLAGRRTASLRVTPTLPTWRVAATGLLVVAVFAAAFGLPRPASSAASAEAAASDGAALPAQGYYLPDYGSWIGRPWHDLELAGWVIGAPAGLETGEQLILFYRKDCEHCHELMELYFVGPLAVPVTAVAVPERDGFPNVGVQPMPCTECSTAELPPGIDWFFQTPVVVRLLDGVVQCAAEEEPAAPACVTW